MTYDLPQELELKITTNFACNFSETHTWHAEYYNFLLHPLCILYIESNVVCSGGSPSLTYSCSNFNGEIFNVLWYYIQQTRDTPLYLLRRTVFGLPIWTFTENPCLHMGKFKPEIMSLKRCLRSGSNTEPHTPQSNSGVNHSTTSAIDVRLGLMTYDPLWNAAQVSKLYYCNHTINLQKMSWISAAEKNYCRCLVTSNRHISTLCIVWIHWHTSLHI